MELRTLVADCDTRTPPVVVVVVLTLVADAADVLRERGPVLAVLKVSLVDTLDVGLAEELTLFNDTREAGRDVAVDVLVALGRAGARDVPVLVLPRESDRGVGFFREAEVWLGGGRREAPGPEDFRIVEAREWTEDADDFGRGG